MFELAYLPSRERPLAGMVESATMQSCGLTLFSPFCESRRCILRLKMLEQREVFVHLAAHELGISDLAWDSWERR
jgi:hypothetical protein